MQGPIVRISWKDEQGEQRLTELQVIPPLADGSKLYYIWKGFEHKMLCMSGSNVPIDNIHRPLGDFDGMTLVARDWTQTHMHIREQLAQVPWP